MSRPKTEAMLRTSSFQAGMVVKGPRSLAKPVESRHANLVGPCPTTVRVKAGPWHRKRNEISRSEICELHNRGGLLAPITANDVMLIDVQRRSGKRLEDRKQQVVPVGMVQFTELRGLM